MKGESVHEGKVNHRQGRKSCLAWDFPMEFALAANGGAMSTGYRKKECRTWEFYALPSSKSQAERTQEIQKPRVLWNPINQIITQIKDAEMKPG